MTESSKPGAMDASEAVTLVLRIATVGLSLASGIMTATSTQCQYDDDTGQPAGTMSYSDYPSLKYAAVADLVSAVLQGVAILLEVFGKEKAAKTVELIDKVVLALTSSAAALVLAVDEIVSCGSRRGGARRGRRGDGLRVPATLSFLGVTAAAVAAILKRDPEALNVIMDVLMKALAPPSSAPPRDTIANRQHPSGVGSIESDPPSFGDSDDDNPPRRDVRDDANSSAPNGRDDGNS